MEFYTDLLETNYNTHAHVSKRVVVEGPLVSESQQRELCIMFTGEDVKAAMFDIDENKSGGPDGYSSAFLKKTWVYIRGDIIDAVLNFFQTRKLLKQINATTLCLVPKVDQPESVTRFRPIACCNVLYKIISKMPCSGLKMVFTSIINPVQIAFVSNRQIMHNILVCQDLLKHYKRKNSLLDV